MRISFETIQRRALSYHFNWCLANEATHEMFIPEDDIALVLPHIQLLAG